ncbi:hypothetical protein ACIA58_29475 [Kribbella sp. NPDC051586]|uniref:hypothetical protein n=1 Tax=Kribbella sp. NPDC051586 TaxID=3364118 RepID=UPI00379FA90A
MRAGQRSLAAPTTVCPGQDPDALLGAVSALMLAVACAVQAVSVRVQLAPRHAQPAGLASLMRNR